ncbi:unnamed protein product [Orchesella dallaii]|uniref:Uncharacterized protein n=1 Tax=Orchesella dallaii TaxID=48710 RepID=A0ABP1PPS2_9HEXA
MNKRFNLPDRSRAGTAGDGTNKISSVQFICLKTMPSTFLISIALYLRFISAELQFPVNLDVECFINVVVTNTTECPPIVLNVKATEYIRTYTLHNLGYLNFWFDDYDESEDNWLTLNQGYLRFNLKYRSNCIIFLLITETVEETHEAIEKSGYGTSEGVLFLIFREHLRDDDEVVQGFTTNLLFETNRLPFHADVMFFQSDGSSKIFCLFCPKKSESLKNSNSSLKLSIATAKSASHKRNRNGYGNHNVVYMPLKVNGGVGKPGIRCFESFRRRTKSQHRDRSGVPIDCEYFIYSIVASMQPMLNITIKLFGRRVQTYHRDWFLNVNYGENVGIVPNEQLKTRAKIVLIGELKFDAMICMERSEMLSFDFNFTSIIHLDFFLCLVSIYILYAFLYKNIFKGIDLVWVIFGKPFLYSHQKQLILLYLVAGVLICNIYQSKLSSESLRLLEFPTFDHFPKAGYKILAMFVKKVKTIRDLLPNDTLNKIEAVIGTRDDTFYLTDQSDDQLGNYSFYSNWVQVVSEITKRKLILPAVLTTTTMNFFEVFVNDVMYVGNETVCKVFRLAKESHVQRFHYFRTWSYMSYRFAEVLEKMGETGMDKRIQGIITARGAQKAAGLGLSHPDSVMMPQKLDMYSVLGVSCLGNCVIGLTILVCFICYQAFCTRWNFQNMLTCICLQCRQFWEGMLAFKNNVFAMTTIYPNQFRGHIIIKVRSTIEHLSG